MLIRGIITMNTSIEMPVSSLRESFMPGTRITGTVDVSDMELSYGGEKIVTLVFRSKQKVEYWGETDNLIIEFQDIAFLDD